MCKNAPKANPVPRPVNDDRVMRAASDEVAAFDAEAAARYLGLRDGEWLKNAPIPWVDMRKPGAARALPRWRRTDLDAFLASRLVQAGHPSPFE